MFNWKNKANKVIGALVLAASVVSFAQLNVNAESVNADGVRYDNDITINVGYVSDYAYGGAGNTYIYLDDSTEHIGNVTSSSANLVAKKTREDIRTTTEKDYDYETDTYKTETRTSRYNNCISFFAKKAGDYTVSFDVLRADNTVRCTKTIHVDTYKTSSSTSAIKSITYDGKELFEYYPYTNKLKGKLSVKANNKYKITKIEIGKTAASGETSYKATKNNKTIQLAKKEKYSRNYSYEVTEYNELFPETTIRISWVNKKTKASGTYITSLYTMNKK